MSDLSCPFLPKPASLFSCWGEVWKGSDRRARQQRRARQGLEALPRHARGMRCWNPPFTPQRPRLSLLSVPDWHFNPPLPAGKAFFLRFVVERTVAPSHCPLPNFSSFWEEKRKKSLKSKEKDCRSAHSSAANHLWGVRGERWGGDQEEWREAQAACWRAEKFPLLFKYY